MTTTLPNGWRQGHAGDLACPHRDCSVCGPCAASRPEVIEVYGQHFWTPDPAERAALRLAMGSATVRA